MENLKNRLMSLLISFICFRSYGRWSVKKTHDIIYTGHDRSKIFHSLLKKAFGDEYPEELECFSFITNKDLKDILEFLSLNKGDTFADLGCGRGGPGMWIAKKTGANLKGIDISQKAVESAEKRIPEFSLEGKAEFKTGNFYSTGLDSDSLDGAVCIDSIWYAPNKEKAFKEAARILKKGAKLVFTTWDGNVPFMPKNHKGFLKNAGFEVEIYKEIQGSGERQKKSYQNIIEAKEILIKEMGKKYASPVIREAQTVMSVADTSTRIIASAKKL